jgi:hypothetical protein
MIDFPDGLPLTAEPMFMPRDVEQRSLTGPTDVFPRLGGRFAIQVSAGPFYAEDARSLLALVMAAKYGGEGLRMRYPLQWSQDGGGATRINGAIAGPTRTLPIKNGTPGFVIRQGWFISVQDANGDHFFHSVAAGTRIASDGTASVTVTPELKAPFPDNTIVNIAVPRIQGLVTDAQIAWPISGDKVAPVLFTLEEKR